MNGTLVGTLVFLTVLGVNRVSFLLNGIELMWRTASPRKTTGFLLLLLAGLFMPRAVGGSALSAENSMTLTTTAATPTRQQVRWTDHTSSAKRFLIDVEINPTATETGDLQAVAGFAIDLAEDPETVLPGRTSRGIGFELREGFDRGAWDIWIDGVNEPRREPSPRPTGWVDNRQYQKPWEFTPRPGPYRLRILGVPETDGTKLRFYFEHFDRPIFEHTTSRVVTPGRIAFYAVTGGSERRSNIATLRRIEVRTITDPAPIIQPSVRDIVLDAIDRSHPAMTEVVAALDSGDQERAGTLLLEHFRTRTEPIGPGFRKEYHGLNYREVADAALENRYGTLGAFANLETGYIDGAGNRKSFVDKDGTIRWDLCHGHLTRHFHWVSLAKSYSETKDSRYAARFSREVQDWVARDPFLNPRNPDIGGLNWMDGTTFRLGYLNTSNIGRRCEMTWWPAYDEFRKTEAFTDDAHFHMLLGFLRQSRLIMNPSSFAVHDDGGAHICVALLQNALMLPEFAESERWEQEAVRRWEQVLKVQFHDDGSHVSLSTGYNWASIMALENMVSLYRRAGREVPERFLSVLENAYRHPIAVSRPNQGQIDLNDSSWGMIDDHIERAYRLFPDRSDFLWMATRGERGSAPNYRSIYFPNAGHIVQRTGWGPTHRYLFMDAGPVGASHGKEDKLNIYLDLGGHQLLASGGRGSYAGGPFTAYTGSTRAFNTVLVDGGVQARIPYRVELDGHTPQLRRFVIGKRFEFAEGFHTHGWFAAGQRTEGTHTRQIVFVKGPKPPETSYWVVFDTIEPADDASHLYEALFHIRRNHAKVVDSESRVVHGWDAAAALRIFPAPAPSLNVKLVHGQTEPHVQGWHVVGKAKAPMWTPIYHWTATGPTTRAWVLVPAGAEQNWHINRVETVIDTPGTLAIRCHHTEGGSDVVYRRDPSGPDQTIERVTLTGDVGAFTILDSGEAGKQFFVRPQKADDQ